MNYTLDDTDFLISRPVKPFARLLLAHGAGAPMDSDYLQQLAGELSAQGIEVWRCNFAYMQKTVAGQKQPPSKVASLMQEMATLIARLPTDLPLFIGGKSMGGRVATLFAATLASTLAATPALSTSQQLSANQHLKLAVSGETINVRGVLAFGYPFCPPAKKQLGIGPRTAHFSLLQRPLLIVQGERDAFGKPEDLKAQQWSKVQICWLAGGDHDFKTLVRQTVTQAQLLAQAAVAARGFMQQVLATPQ